MKRNEFDIYFYCGKCKEPIKTHPKYHFGYMCPSNRVEFEEENK